MCTVCALLFLVHFITLFQSFIHNVQVLLFRIWIVDITECGLFIYLSENIPYLIQRHSFRTQATCSSPSCAMRTFVCNSCISAIFTKPIGNSSCCYSLPVSFKDKFTFGIKLSGFTYDILCYVSKRDKAILRIIFLFQMLYYLNSGTLKIFSVKDKNLFLHPLNCHLSILNIRELKCNTLSNANT